MSGSTSRFKSDKKRNGDKNLNMQSFCKKR